MGGGRGRGMLTTATTTGTWSGMHPTLPRFWNSDCRIAEAPEAGSEADWACRAGDSNPRSNRDASVEKQLCILWQVGWGAPQWR